MKTALISGGAIRIGAQIVRTLHEDGYKVIIHCHHSEEIAQKLCNELNSKRNGSAQVVVADLGENEAIKKLIKLIKNRDLPDTFFGCFVTKLDPLDEEKLNEIVALEIPLIIKMSATYNLHPLSRIAYQFIENELVVFINGNTLQITNINDDVIIGFCNTRKIKVDDKNKRLALQFSELSLLEETHPKI